MKKLIVIVAIELCVILVLGWQIVQLKAQPIGEKNKSETAPRSDTTIEPAFAENMEEKNNYVGTTVITEKETVTHMNEDTFATEQEDQQTEEVQETSEVIIPDEKEDSQQTSPPEVETQENQTENNGNHYYEGNEDEGEEDEL